jgi:hypothetical protein
MLFFLFLSLSLHQCQEMKISSLNQTHNKYDYYMAPGGIAGSNVLYTPCTVNPKTGPSSLPGVFDEDYNFPGGGPGHDDWYFLDSAQGFVLLWYCGYNYQGSYVGGVVMGPAWDAVIPAEVEAQFAQTIEKAQFPYALAYSDYQAIPNAACVTK